MVAKTPGPDRDAHSAPPPSATPFEEADRISQVSLGRLSSSGSSIALAGSINNPSVGELKSYREELFEDVCVISEEDFERIKNIDANRKLLMEFQSQIRDIQDSFRNPNFWRDQASPGLIVDSRCQRFNEKLELYGFESMDYQCYLDNILRENYSTLGVKKQKQLLPLFDRDVLEESVKQTQIPGQTPQQISALLKENMHLDAFDKIFRHLEISQDKVMQSACYEALSQQSQSGITAAILGKISEPILRGNLVLAMEKSKSEIYFEKTRDGIKCTQKMTAPMQNMEKQLTGQSIGLTASFMLIRDSRSPKGYRVEPLGVDEISVTTGEVTSRYQTKTEQIIS